MFNLLSSSVAADFVSRKGFKISTSISSWSAAVPVRDPRLGDNKLTRDASRQPLHATHPAHRNPVYILVCHHCVAIGCFGRVALENLRCLDRVALLLVMRDFVSRKGFKISTPVRERVGCASVSVASASVSVASASVSVASASVSVSSASVSDPYVPRAALGVAVMCWGTSRLCRRAFPPTTCQLPRCPGCIPWSQRSASWGGACGTLNRYIANMGTNRRHASASGLSGGSGWLSLGSGFEYRTGSGSSTHP